MQLIRVYILSLLRKFNLRGTTVFAYLFVFTLLIIGFYYLNKFLKLIDESILYNFFQNNLILLILFDLSIKSFATSTKLVHAKSFSMILTKKYVLSRYIIYINLTDIKNYILLLVPIYIILIQPVDLFLAGYLIFFSIIIMAMNKLLIMILNRFTKSRVVDFILAISITYLFQKYFNLNSELLYTYSFTIFLTLFFLILLLVSLRLYSNLNHFFNAK